jgi:hypothetical protein
VLSTSAAISTIKNAALKAATTRFKRVRNLIGVMVPGPAASEAKWEDLKKIMRAVS